LAKGTFGTVYTGKVPGRTEAVVIKDMHTVNDKSIAEWKKELLIMAYGFFFSDILYKI
jgi:hypothetical protein